MNGTTLSEIHSDHVNWLKEDDLWHDDLRAWQSELKRAMAQTEELKELLVKHEQRLRQHAASVRALEQDTRVAEHELAECAQVSSNGDYTELSQKHIDEASKHASQRATHEQLKKIHHILIANWNTLYKALHESAQAQSAVH